MSICFTICILTAIIVPPIYATDSILLVTKDKAVSDKWFKIMAQDVPQFRSTSSIFQNQQIAVVVFYKEPSTDSTHQAKICFDLKIVFPDGNSTERKDIKVLDGKISEAKMVRLSEEIPYLTFDEPGTYQIQVSVRDIKAKTMQIHKKTIEVKEYSNNKYFNDINTFSIWMNTYYQSLTPEKIIDGMLFFAHGDPKIRNKSFPQVSVFFGKTLSDNQYLIPYLLKIYPEQDNDTKIMILGTLPYIKHDYSEFINHLPDNEKRFYFEWQNQNIQYPDSGIKEPTTIKKSIRICYQMDMLWSYFFASGEYQPIKQLVEVLELGKFKGGLEKYTQTNSSVDEENAAKELVYKAARWSIETNIKKHRLVKDYCEFIYTQENLPPRAKQELKEILGGN
jgi:hypothetical protein